MTADEAHSSIAGLLDFVREPLALLDGAMRVIAVSRAFCTAFETEREAIEGCRINECSGGRWNIPQLRHLLDTVITTGVEADGLEVRHRFDHIGEKVLLLRARPLVPEHRGPLRIILSIEDITRQKELEESAANRELESFSYSVSHDLRTPLRTVGACAGFLMEDYADGLDDQGRDFVRRIDHGVGKMQRIIDDMLALSRIGRQEMKREDVDLSAMVRSYLRELCESDPRRELECIVQDDVHAYADPRLIHLALENLLRNAWKFTSQREDTRIEFGVTQRDSRTVYFVRDNGVGFDMQFARRIFEPFQRVHAEQQFRGTGVGLSIVQRVIGRHGGEVWAEGQVGEGATFYFMLGTQGRTE